MSFDAQETAWLGADNEVEWVIFRDGEPLVLLIAILRVVVCFGGVVLDSLTSPGDVWWSDSVTDRPLKDGTLFTGEVLKARLGRTPNLVEGDYDTVRLTVFDEDHPNGLVVSDSIFVSVKDSCV
jgi:hypothetical protein